MSPRPVSRVMAIFLGSLVMTASLASAEPLPGRPEQRPLTVLIDPGHGGSNTGAPGREPGSYEKKVTLALARVLQRRLEREGVRVELTRQTDQYLTLRERSRMANALRPDCFLSLHTNASPDHARRGIETYVLAREGVEVEARREAGRAADEVEGLLSELRFLETHRASAALAARVQSRLVRAADGPHLDRGVRQAGYDVLSEVKVPAALVEVGFIDHPVEGPALLRPEVQARLADALAEGILDFLRPAERAPQYAQALP